MVPIFKAALPGFCGAQDDFPRSELALNNPWFFSAGKCELCDKIDNFDVNCIFRILTALNSPRYQPPDHADGSATAAARRFCPPCRTLATRVRLDHRLGLEMPIFSRLIVAETARTHG
jgi:hypothetical protein